MAGVRGNLPMHRDGLDYMRLCLKLVPNWASFSLCLLKGFKGNADT
jgi:hypothetical protein